MYTRGLANLVLLYGQTPSTLYIEGTNRRQFDKYVAFVESQSQYAVDKCVAFVEKQSNSC